MAGNIFERIGVNLMEKVLNVSSQRQRIVAGNIANAMTPGYVRKELNFEENLAQAMGKNGLQGLMNDHRHIPIGNVNIEQQPIVVHDVNSDGTDIEKEMAASAENQLLYASVAKIISGKFKSLQMVIRGRG